MLDKLSLYFYIVKNRLYKLAFEIDRKTVTERERERDKDRFVSISKCVSMDAYASLYLFVMLHVLNTGERERIHARVHCLRTFTREISWFMMRMMICAKEVTAPKIIPR